MKRKFFMACATLVVSAATVVGVKAYNYYSMSQLMRANLEALSKSESYDYTEYKAPVFKQTYTADVKTIHGGYLFDPISTMYIWKDYFIIKTKSIDNKCEFQVLSTSDGHQITGFGFKGRGENELSSFTNSNTNPQNGYITVTDYDGKIALYNIDNIIKTGSPNPEQCYKLPRFPRGKVMQLNGKLVHLESVPRIFMTNMQCVDTVGTIRKIPAISPEIDKDSIDKMMYYVHSSKWAARPDGKKLCNFTRNGMIMEIYDINSSTITPTTLRYFYKPKMVSCRAGRADDSCIVGACSVSATNEYIYCLYSDSLRENPEAVKYYIGVFDWKGREICRYQIQNAYEIAVTPDDKRCYVWGQNADGEEYLGYFDLK